MTDEQKLKMVYDALVLLVDAVGGQKASSLTRATLDAFHVACGAIDGLRFVESMQRKESP